jgi:hypothetical protein
MGGRLPTYLFTTRNRAMIGAWLVVIEQVAHADLLIADHQPIGRIDGPRRECCSALFAVHHMKNIVERVLHSCDQEVARDVRGKISNYIGLLASTGKTDEQLVALGVAYLKELLEPDPRYSGC